MLNWIGKRPFQAQMGWSDSEFYRWQKRAKDDGFKVFRKIGERTPVIDIPEVNRYISWKADQYDHNHMDIHLRMEVQA